MGNPIKGTNVFGPVVPFNTDDIYASHKATYGHGGWRTVKDLNERNTIISDRREDLMIVAVEDNSFTQSTSGVAFYLLDVHHSASTSTSLMDNNNWVLLNFGYGGDGWIFPPPPQSVYQGKRGQRSFDETYLYICVEDNLWKRVAIDWFVDSGTAGFSGGTAGHSAGVVPIWGTNGEWTYDLVVRNVDAIDSTAGNLLVTFTNNTTKILEIGGDRWILPPPMSSVWTGEEGDRSYDDNYFYVCIQDNLWKRVAYDFFIFGGSTSGGGNFFSLPNGYVPIWNSTTNMWDFNLVVSKTYVDNTSGILNIVYTNGYSTSFNISTTLTSLTDVTINNATSGDVLMFDSNTNTWINQLFPGIIWTLPAPLTSTSAGNKGDLSYDDNFIYVCIGTNSWKRINIDYFIFSGSTSGSMPTIPIGSVPVWDGNEYASTFVVTKVEPAIQSGVYGETITYSSGTSTFIPFGTMGGTLSGDFLPLAGGTMGGNINFIPNIGLHSSSFFISKIMENDIKFFYIDPVFGPSATAIKTESSTNLSWVRFKDNSLLLASQIKSTQENANIQLFENNAGIYNNYSGTDTHIVLTNTGIYLKSILPSGIGGSAILSTALLTSANRTYQFPDKSGTLALLSDITNSTSGGGRFGTVGNGLTLEDGLIKLGGTLIEDTTIDGTNFNITFNVNEFIVNSGTNSTIFKINDIEKFRIDDNGLGVIPNNKIYSNDGYNSEITFFDSSLENYGLHMRTYAIGGGDYQNPDYSVEYKSNPGQGFYQALESNGNYGRVLVTSTQTQLQTRNSNTSYGATFDVYTNYISFGVDDAINSSYVSLDSSNGLGIKTDVSSFGIGFLKTDFVTNNRTYQFPDKSGTLALISDVVGNYIPLTGTTSGGKVTGDIEFSSNNRIWRDISNGMGAPVSEYVPFNSSPAFGYPWNNLRTYVIGGGTYNSPNDFTLISQDPGAGTYITTRSGLQVLNFNVNSSYVNITGGSLFINGGGVEAGTYLKVPLIQGSYNHTQIDIDNKMLFANEDFFNTGIVSLDWSTRGLYNSSGDLVLNWGNEIEIYAQGVGFFNSVGSFKAFAPAHFPGSYNNVLKSVDNTNSTIYTEQFQLSNFLYQVANYNSNYAFTNLNFLGWDISLWDNPSSRSYNLSFSTAGLGIITNISGVKGLIKSDLINASHIYQVPNKSGTIALLDDVINNGSNFVPIYNGDIFIDNMSSLNYFAITSDNGGYNTTWFEMDNTFFYLGDQNANIDFNSWTANAVTIRNIVGDILIDRNNTKMNFKSSGIELTTTGNFATLHTNLLSSQRDFQFPNNSGTLALISDISNESTTAGNGLHMSGKAVSLGGSLYKNTEVNAGDNTLTFSGTSGANNKVYTTLQGGSMTLSAHRTDIYRATFLQLTEQQSFLGYEDDYSSNYISAESRGMVLTLNGANSAVVNTTLLTDVRNYQFPDKDGTIALVDDTISKIYTQLVTQTRVGDGINAQSDVSLLSSSSGNLGSNTIDANSLAVGDTVKLKMRGYMNIFASGTFTFTVKLGATTLVSRPSVVISHPKTNQLIDIEFEFTVRQIGATGKVLGNGVMLISVGTVATPVTAEFVMTNATTINTTVSQTLDFTVAWSAGFNGNLNITTATIKKERI